MYKAVIAIEAMTQEDLAHALKIVSVDLNDSDLAEGNLKIKCDEGKPCESIPYRLHAEFSVE